MSLTEAELLERVSVEPASNLLPTPEGWPRLDPVARYGLAGEFLNVIEPHTEADAPGLLGDFLTSFGNAVGQGPHIEADGARHVAALFVLLVGDTSRSRKGTTRRQVARLFEGVDASPAVDAGWAKNCVKGGLASGEGLVAALQDPPEGEPRRDRRLLLVEEEFARLLVAAGREGSTLSHIARQAWDGREIAVLTRKDPLTAPPSHVSLIGHITEEELRRRLVSIEAANGFGNRFLPVLMRRSKLLPSGSRVPPADFVRLIRLIRTRLEDARKRSLIARSPDAEGLWADLYRRVAEDDSRGMVGALLARAEAQLLRLSLVYALTDASPTIEVRHLEAAWALWRYSAASVEHIFGTTLGDETADRLLAAIREAGAKGLDRAGQYAAFGRHVEGYELDRARGELERQGLIVTLPRETGGRPQLISYAKEAKEAKEGPHGP